MSSDASTADEDVTEPPTDYDSSEGGEEGEDRPSPTSSAEQAAAVASVVAAVDEARRPGGLGVRRHVLLDAVAGAGKTRTLLAIVQAVCARWATDGGGVRILLLAFNRHMAAELRRRLPGVACAGGATVDVLTLHALGLRLCEQQRSSTTAVGLKRGHRGTVVVDPDKAWRWYTQLAPETARAGGLAGWNRLRQALDRWRQEGRPLDGGRGSEGPAPLVEALVAALAADRACVDPEDQIYQPVHHRWRVSPPYDLVLVDEAQDLNGAQHRLLRECVVPADERTVLCAVGDACQAVYAFRGACPASMDRLAERFGGMERRRLTCCFRCPRRVVRVAGRLNRWIQARPGAPTGALDVRVVDGEEAVPATLADLSDPAGQTGPTCFVARTNHALLGVLRRTFLVQAGAEGLIERLSWLSPVVAEGLHDLRRRGLQRPGLSVRGHLAQARATVAAQASLDRTLARILEAAVDLEGPGVTLHESRWLAFLRRVVLGEEADAANPGLGLVLATVHAVKGLEFRPGPPPPPSRAPGTGRGPRSPHVIVYEYNLFGRQTWDPDGGQEDNLLYIALTRSTQRLTLLLNRRTERVPSPYLPLDLLDTGGVLAVPP